MSDIFSQPIDQGALTLARAIELKESGNNGMPNYDAIGDAGTSAGAGQWNNGKTPLTKGQIPANFKSDALKYGLNPMDFSPENQDKVMYAKVYTQKQQGMSPDEIAAAHNAGIGAVEDGSWKTNVGDTTINGQKIHYDTPGYVKDVQANYQKLYGQQAPQSSNNSGFNPQPFSHPDTSATGIQDGTNVPPLVAAPTQNPSTDAGFLGNLNKGDYGGAAVDAAKGVGNFLFPIVGDVYHDIKGDSNKSFLQQAGDTALSALPFIPGLGEAGEGARAAELGVEGAGAVADAAKGGGLLAKFAASPVAKGALTGYGAGVASNLSQGQGLGQSFIPNVNNVAGAVLGGATPAVMKGLGKLTNYVSGIDPQIENELTKMGTQGNPEDVKLYDQYMNATKAHATNLQATSPLTMAANKLDTAAEQIQTKAQEAGAAVGAAKKAAATMPVNVQDLAPIANDFRQQVADRFGINLASDETGKIVGTPIEESMRKISPQDLSRIEDAAQQLNKLGDGANVRNATEVLSNINDDLDFHKNAYGQSNSPVDGLLKYTAGTLNDAVGKSAPDLAAANERFSNLKTLQEEMAGMAGKNLNRGELLMKRVFSPDKSGEVQGLFGKIKQETGIDLTKHAVLAKHAIQSFGSNADKSLLQQAIEGGVKSAGGGGLLGGAYDFGTKILKKNIANPERIGRNLVKGKVGGLLGNIATKAAIEAGSRGSGIPQ